MRTTIFIMQILPNGVVKPICKLGGNGQLNNPDINTVLRAPTARVVNLCQTDSERDGTITLSITVEE